MKKRMMLDILKEDTHITNGIKSSYKSNAEKEEEERYQLKDL